MNFQKYFINKLSDKTRNYLHERGVFKEAVEYNEGLSFIDEIRRHIKREHLPYSKDIGTHPDFRHLEENNEFELGHLCSVSIDIRSSTRMNLKYDQEVVKDIKQSVIKSVIDIYTAFDGHIHRLQGDGVVVFFRNTTKVSQCLIDAINASVFLLRFREVSLSKVFEQFGLKNVKLRIGLDFGKDEHVLWSKYGTRNITEVTASGVNVDLAFKIQQKIPSNSIGIGENVIKYLDFREELLDINSHTVEGKTVKDPYIMNNPHYKYYLLKWKKYINDVFTVLNENTKLIIDLTARQQVSEGEFNENQWVDIVSGSDCLEKNFDLHFQAKYKGDESVGKYRWVVQNYGEEASSYSEESLSFDMENYLEDFCEQKTAYTSLHYMCCTVYSASGRTLTSKKYGVYINDENREVRDLRKEYIDG